MNARKCNTLRKYIAKSSSKWEILVLSDIVVSSTAMKNVEIGRRKEGNNEAGWQKLVVSGERVGR